MPTQTSTRHLVTTLTLLSVFMLGPDTQGVVGVHEVEASSGFVEEAMVYSDHPTEGGYFGRHVATYGDVLVVGAPHEDVDGVTERGAAYVFVRDVNGDWDLAQRLTDPDGGQGDRFGTSVGVSEGSAFVGAPGATSVVDGSGVVFTYERNGMEWSNPSKIFANNIEAGSLFGFSLSIREQTLVVGAPGQLDGSGTAFVFEETAGSWGAAVQIDQTEAAGNDFFGFSVDQSRDSIIVGAPLHDLTKFVGGAAFVFDKRAGSWEQRAALSPSDSENGDQFGFSVAIDGETAIVGQFEDVTVRTQGRSEGSAYVFELDGETWSQTTILTASNKSPNDWFGHTVSLHGGVALIGAPLVDLIATDAGAIYPFTKRSGEWIEGTIITAAAPSASALFGASIAMSDEHTAVGGFTATAQGISEAGSAHVFATPPPSARAQQVTLDEDTPANLSLIEPISAEVEVEITRTPMNGSLDVSNLPEVTYTPKLDFNGTDQFSFSVRNRLGVPAAAAVTLNVTAVDDPMTWGAATPSEGQEFSVVLGERVSFELEAQDVDTTPFEPVYAVRDLSGTSTITAANTTEGTFDWTPQESDAGGDDIVLELSATLGGDSLTRQVHVVLLPNGSDTGHGGSDAGTDVGPDTGADAGSSKKPTESSPNVDGCAVSMPAMPGFPNGLWFLLPLAILIRLRRQPA